MKGIEAGVVLFVCALTSIDVAAQPADPGCSSENSSGMTQTVHCDGGITIVAENGARYTLRGDRKGRVRAVELDGKALLIQEIKFF